MGIELGVSGDSSDESEIESNKKRKIKRRKIYSSSEENQDKSQTQRPKSRKKRKLETVSDSGSSDEATDDGKTQREKVAGGSTFFRCSLCSFTAKSAGKIYSHKVDVHKVDKLVCNFCKFSTKNSTSMHNHKRLYCPKLKRKTKENQKEMESPIYIQTEEGHRYKCRKCDFIAGSGGAVYKHMADFHGMEKFTCTYCKFSTGNKTSMYNHKTRYCREIQKR